MPLLQILRLKNWREITIGGLVLGVLFIAFQWKKADSELKKVRLAYENPSIKEVVRVVRIEGPIRTITKIVDRPTGERETVIKESRSSVSEIKESAIDKMPISLGVILSEQRTDRYLVTVGAGRLSTDLDRKALLAGYGFKNRLDVQAGIIKDISSSAWVFATFRF